MMMAVIHGSPILFKNSPAAAAGLAAVCLAVAGCGKSGVPRLALRGDVTFNGAPVPAGSVRFEPDTKRGGSGPVGYAAIVDGRYDTRNGGKGPVAGPMRVIVSGVQSSKPFAPPLFPRYTTQMELEDGMRTLDLDVPANSST